MTSIIKSIKYKGYTIDLNFSGWYSCYVSGKGYLKADTLKGIKKLISEV